MTQPALDYFTRRGFLCKIETTEGTDATPSNTTDGVLLLNGSVSTAFDTIERPVDTPYLGNDPISVANTRGLIEGDFEIFSPATPGQVSTGNYVQESLLLASGMAVTKSASAPKSTTYSPISSAFPSATMYGWIVDKKRALLGSRGNITGLTMKIGDRFKGHLQMQGNYTFSEVALPSITTYGTVPAVSTYLNSTLIINCAAASITNLSTWAKQLSIDFGNTLATAEYTTKKVNRITDRKGTFTLLIARTALADFNPWAIRDAGQILTLAYKLDEGGTLHTTLNVRGQIENISEQSIDGDSGWQITGRCIPSSAGNDEFSIVHLDV
jgi:hypothetical protein